MRSPETPVCLSGHEAIFIRRGGKIAILKELRNGGVRIWPRGSEAALSEAGITKERVSKTENLSEFLVLARGERVSMSEQAVSGEPFTLAGSFQGKQRDVPVRQPLSVLSNIVAIMSHDLRLPLAAILANAEFLTQSGLSEIERNDFYGEIRSAIDRMNEMVSSLLECSKGVDTLRPAVRNIVDTVEQAIRMTSVRQEFRRITITHHHEGLATGWFDSSRFERAVANLILNSCEAVSAESGQIVISTIGNRACLQIGVWDDGPGIPATIQQSVFLPFVSYGKASGNGLGLAIAKKVVEDHGGEIYVDERCKTGTLFKITIPFAVPKGEISRISLGPLVHSLRMPRSTLSRVNNP